MNLEVDVVFSGGKKVDAVFDGFTVRTDQPEKYGGEGSAPAPSEYFFASLAACAGYYVQAFCRFRKLDTDGLALKMTCASDPKTKLVGKITFELTLPKGFPEKDVEKIRRNVDDFYVKKHLFQPPEFEVVTKRSE